MASASRAMPVMGTHLQFLAPWELTSLLALLMLALGIRLIQISQPLVPQ
jgi:hypothetical protein